jgi:hypothetical protein
LKNMTVVLVPVLDAEPLSDGVKTVVSTGWIDGVVGPVPEVLVGPPGVICAGAEGPVSETGSLLHAERTTLASTVAAREARCMDNSFDT